VIAVDPDRSGGVLRATCTMGDGATMATFDSRIVLAGNTSTTLLPASVQRVRFLEPANTTFEIEIRLPAGVGASGEAAVAVRGLEEDGAGWLCVEPRGGLATLSETLGDEDGGYTCPDGRSGCADDNTCCPDPYGGYGCCQAGSRDNPATCCDDKVHCCPPGVACGGSGECKAAPVSQFSFAIRSPTKWLTKAPPLEARLR